MCVCVCVKIRAYFGRGMRSVNNMCINKYLKAVRQSTNQPINQFYNEVSCGRTRLQYYGTGFNYSHASLDPIKTPCGKAAHFRYRYCSTCALYKNPLFTKSQPHGGNLFETAQNRQLIPHLIGEGDKLYPVGESAWHL